MTDAPGLDLTALLVAAETAARAGGDIVAEHFGAPRGVREKGPGDWISAADLGSEAAVRSSLDRDTPDIAFFGEELGGEQGARAWYVDPLDGTANFVHGLEAFAVSVALVEDGRPVVGVVHAPLLGHTYTATHGGGAFRDGVPIRVSDRDPDRAICATGFPFRHKELLPEYLSVFSAALACFEDLRRVGAASLDLCWTAEGVFDGYFERALSTWDVAAGGLVVQEAGGTVTDWEGDDGAWLRTGDILAGPPAVHVVLQALAALRARDEKSG